MRNILFIIPVLLVLAGCGEKVTTKAEEKEPIKEMVPVAPEVKEEVKEMKEVVTTDDKDTLVTYEVPELGIAFDIEKRYADDLVYEYNSEHDYISFNSQNLVDRYNCHKGQSGGVSKISAHDQCTFSETIHSNNEYNYCFGGPHALCAPTSEEEFADDVTSARIVRKALQTLREL